MNRVVLTIVAVTCLTSAFAEPAAFEVASVKLSPPPVPGKGLLVRGGPGSSDPGLVTMENIDLFSLVELAYGVNRYQLIAPEWLSATRVHISARLPQGTTVDQYRQMLQTLLAERFALTLHRDRKEIQMYGLVVAKEGPKLNEVEADSSLDGLQPPRQPATLPPGAHIPVNVTLAKISMERFAALLSSLLGQTIVDDTGLKGTYQISLRMMTGSNPTTSTIDNPTPDVFEAVQQLGLRLVPKKDLVDVLVIDRMEKSPAEN